MELITLNAPEGALTVPYGKLKIGVELDGTIAVPPIAVAALIEAGCTALPEAAEPPTLADRIAATEDAEELAYFIKAFQQERRPLVTPFTATALGAAGMRTLAQTLLP